MRIIPAMDILNGRCVRLTKGNYNSVRIYDGDPLDLARAFEDNGLKYLHIVDLDGAREKKIVNQRHLESIALSTSLKIDFGGGIRSDDDIRIAFGCGASQVNIGSTAAADPGLSSEWLFIHGKERIILSADSFRRKIKVSGWMEETDIDVIQFISSWEKKGISYVVCTDISRDGTLEGPATGLYSEIISVSNINLIASGGVSSVEDIDILKRTGCEGVIIGKALYEGKIDLKELSGLC
ncbi:MAG: 1-(5-phosphoribosyl)-5-[(5-phosphoribosylamino)methylideneamino]imidazole-4-carboxamide isomerase [Bacteroidales bacterium]|jgi:phosphoribosylformimino-5-aminoimidazole carboxamide ribotide isomerase